MITQDRASEVLARLAQVTDPELDESVTELGFVTGISVGESGHVTLGFRLPTYWCAANFSYLMADDMRRAIQCLPWVTGVTLTLDEHMYQDTINRAMAERLSFQEAFGAEADGDLDSLRRVFDVKAFQRRQLAVIELLQSAGHTAEAMLSLSISDLRAIAIEPEAATVIHRYLERRHIPGCASDSDAAFVDAMGRAVTPEGFLAHRRALRGVAVNVEFNGALCRGLLAARYSDAALSVPAEPTLLDFVHGRVPARIARV